MGGGAGCHGGSAPEALLGGGRVITPRLRAGGCLVPCCCSEMKGAHQAAKQREMAAWRASQAAERAAKREKREAAARCSCRRGKGGGGGHACACPAPGAAPGCTCIAGAWRSCALKQPCTLQAANPPPPPPSPRRDMAWGLVQLAERVVEWRAATGGQAASKQDWRNWTAMFCAGGWRGGGPAGGTSGSRQGRGPWGWRRRRRAEGAGGLPLVCALGVGKTGGQKTWVPSLRVPPLQRPQLQPPPLPLAGDPALGTPVLADRAQEAEVPAAPASAGEQAAATALNAAAVHEYLGCEGTWAPAVDGVPVPAADEKLCRWGCIAWACGVRRGGRGC